MVTVKTLIYSFELEQLEWVIYSKYIPAYDVTFYIVVRSVQVLRVKS